MSDEIETGALKTVTKGAGIIFLGTLFADLISYLTRMFVGRWLGPSNYGLFTLGLAVLGILTTISLFGLNTGVTRYISYFKGKDDNERIKGTITTSFKICFPISLLLSGTFFVFSREISGMFFHNLQLVPILQVFSLVLPFNILLSLNSSSIRGFQRPKYKVYANDVFYNVSKLVLVVTAVFLGFGAFGVAVGWGLAIIATAIISGYYLERRIFPIIKTKIKSEMPVKELILFSLPLMAGSTIKLLLGWSDIILLGFLKTSIDVGIYGAALPTAGIIRMVLLAFGFLLMPVMTELLSRGKKNEMRAIFTASTRWVFIITLPIFILMMLFPGTILGLLFGPEYLGPNLIGVVALSILAVGFFYTAITGPVVEVMISLGKTKTYMAISTLISIMNLALNLILIPVYGIAGAALAMSASLSLGSTLFLISMYRLLGFQPYSMKLVKPLLSGVLAGAFIFIASNTLFQTISLPEAVLLGLSFLLVYTFSLLLTKPFTQEDLEIMKGIERKSGLRIGFLRKIIKRFI